MEMRKMSIEEKEKLRRKSFKLKLELAGLKLLEAIISFIVLLGIQIVMMIPILNVFIFCKIQKDSNDLAIDNAWLKSRLKKYEPEDELDILFHGYQTEVKKENRTNEIK